MILPALGGVTLAFFALVVIYGYNIVWRFKLRSFPGPKPSWLLGCIPEFLSKGPGQSHLVMQEWREKYGKLYRYFIGQVPFVVVSDPSMIQQICTRRFMQFHDRGDVITILGDAKIKDFQKRGLLFSTGKFWAGVRATCEPMFHRAALQGYIPMMRGSVDKMVDRVSGLADTNESVPISDVLADMTMDVIGQTIFGVDFKAQEKEQSTDVVKYARAIFLPYGGMRPWVSQLSFIAPFGRSLWYELGCIFARESIEAAYTAFGYIWGATFMLLQNALKSENGPTLKAPLHTKGFKAGEEAFKNEVPPPSSFTHMIRKATNRDTGEGLSETDICAQSFTMLVAGYETTALSLSYLFYVVAKYPDVQQSILKEIDAFGRTKDVKYEDLESFKYIEGVFKETMRMYPPVSPIVALKREAGPGAAIGDIAIPEGTRVQFNIWDLHHNPEYFPSPDEFRPARFIENDPEYAEEHAAYKPRHPYAYIPFGAGAHKCIGYRFAQEEALLSLVLFFQRFEVRLDKEHHKGELTLQNAITLTPKGGIWVKIYKRKE